MRLVKCLCLLSATLLNLSCDQSNYGHGDRYEQNQKMAAALGTPLEEILLSSPIYGANDFSDVEANLTFNNRPCDILDNLSDIDGFHPSWTAQKCKIGFESEHYIKISSFVSPLGKMPYVELGRTEKKLKAKNEEASIAMILVGAPNNSIWDGTNGGFAAFLKATLSEYDTVYVPAFYGTLGRQKAVGQILDAGAEELDLFLDFVTLKNAAKADVLSASGGGPLSSLLKSSNVQRNIMVNPPLASMKQIYRQRNLTVFHGSPRDKKLKTGNSVGLGDIITLEKGSSRLHVENEADFLVRYFGTFFDVALVDYVDSDQYKFQNCLYILIGKEDETIGREFVDLDNMSISFETMEGVDHIFIDTARERKTVVEAIRDVRLRNELCDD